MGRFCILLEVPLGLNPNPIHSSQSPSTATLPPFRRHILQAYRIQNSYHSLHAIQVDELGQQAVSAHKRLLQPFETWLLACDLTRELDV